MSSPIYLYMMGVYKLTMRPATSSSTHTNTTSCSGKLLRGHMNGMSMRILRQMFRHVDPLLLLLLLTSPTRLLLLLLLSPPAGTRTESSSSAAT